MIPALPAALRGTIWTKGFEPESLRDSVLRMAAGHSWTADTRATVLNGEDFTVFQNVRPTVTPPFPQMTGFISAPLHEAPGELNSNPA